MLFLHFYEFQERQMDYCATIIKNLELKLSIKRKEIRSIGKYTFPFPVTNINEIHSVLKYTEKLP